MTTVTQPPPSRILAISPQGIGDALQSAPALVGVRKAWPEARITVAVKSPVEGSLLVAASAADDFIAIGGWRRPNLQLLKTLVSIRRRRFDMAISMPGIHPLLASLLARWTGAKCRVGERKGRLGWLQNVELKPPRWQHNVRRNMSVLSALGLPESPTDITLALSASNEMEADTFLRENSIEPGDRYLIGMAPGSGIVEAHKRWPTKNFGRLARLLGESMPDAICIVIGSKEEMHLASSISDSATGVKVIDATGATDVFTAAALLRRCSVAVTADNGLMHLAGAVGTGTVSIFGPSEPQISGPVWGNRAIFKANLGCAPCYRRGYVQGCGFPVCMDVTTPEAVMQSIIDLRSSVPQRSISNRD